MKQKTFPPLLFALTELPNVTSPKTLENRFVPFPVFLPMPVTRDCGHCSSWCFCQSEGGSRGLWAFGGLITVDPWWMAFDGGVFGRSFLRGKLETRIYMCILYIYTYTCLYVYIYIHRWIILYTLFLPVGLIAYSEQKERKDINEFSHIDPPICRKDVMRAMARSWPGNSVNHMTGLNNAWSLQYCTVFFKNKSF